MTRDFRMPMLSKWCVPGAWLLRLAVQLTVSASAAAQSVPAVMTQPALMDRQSEIALALSACPAFAADKAAVYVLEESGYGKVRDSQNGFTAIVQHSVPTAQLLCGSPLLAQSGHTSRVAQCPPSGVKRTKSKQGAKSAYDPKRTWVSSNSRSSLPSACYPWGGPTALECRPKWYAPRIEAAK